MKRKKFFKKSLAFACVGTMLASSATAFAAPSSFTGSGSVENDNSVAPSYFNVVMPTITSTTYNFTIDTDKLLEKYDPVGEYDTNSNVYFSAIKTPASVALVTPSNVFYEQQYVEDGTGGVGTGILGELNATTKLKLSALTFTKDYYVWQPDTSSDTTKAEGAGKWTKIDATNIQTFLDLTINADGDTIDSASLKSSKEALSGAAIWDSKIYAYDYVKMTDQDKIAAYFTADPDGNVTNVANGIFTGADPLPAGTSPVQVVAADVTYTPAAYVNKGESQKATLTNKSTQPVVIRTDVSLPANNGLTFVDATTDFSASAGAALCMQIKDKDGNTTSVATTGSGNASTTGATEYYLLTEAAETAVTYQSDEIDPVTGSHNYYQYVPAPVGTNTVYSDVYFTLTAAANDTQTAGTMDPAVKKAWADYIAALRANSAVKPDITVVYDFEKVEVDATVADKKTYIGVDDNGDATGSKYTIATAGTSGQATQTATATPPTPVAPTPGYIYWDTALGSNGGYWLGPDPDDGDTAFAANATVSSVTVNNVAVQYTFTADKYITVDWDDIVAVGQDSASLWTFLYTVDGTTYTAEMN